MPRFNIIQSQPETSRKYREQIISFWRDYLPGTPFERFEWMETNPAGPAVWFLAFDTTSETLIGTVSIMLRELLLDNKVYRAGIIGDYMVAPKHRAFGPAMQLQKTAIERMSDLGISFIYGIPNDKSTKNFVKIGYETISSLDYFIRPIKASFYIGKHFGKIPATTAKVLIDRPLKWISSNLNKFSHEVVEEAYEVNISFDRFWDKYKIQKTEMIGVRNASYLLWRYFKNPLNKFRFLTCRKKNNDDELLGVTFFTVFENKLEIFDLMALKDSYANKLIQGLIKVALAEDCHAVYIRLSENKNMAALLRSHFFIKTRDDVHLYAIGDKNIYRSKWNFLEGDRNI